MDGIDEIVREFLIESEENLDQLDQDLIALESAPGSRDLLSSVFRTIHTIKGTSGFLAFAKLEAVTHVGESLLVDLRDGRREMDEPTTTLLLRMVDTVRAILTQIEHDGSETGVETVDVVAAIQAALDGTPPPASGSAERAEVAERAELAARADAAAPAEPGAHETLAAQMASVSTGPVPDESAVLEASILDDVSPNDAAREPASTPAVTKITPRVRKAIPATTSGVENPAPIAQSASTAGAGHSAPTGTAAQCAPVSATATVASVTPISLAASPTHTPAATPGGDSPRTGVARSSSESSIRVDVDLLDELMRQVGELVLVRNQIAQITGPGADPELTRSSQRLSLIATELQEGVMKTRMQPIDHIWNKMPRIVRDLAGSCGVQVDLQMIGGDTELDRSLLESVKDPLTHLVRNAIDHGIESPDERVASGKPAHGVLTLRAYHAGGQVMVEVRDDGKGIDPLKVAAKVLERGLRTIEQLDAMSTTEILGLVFLPGFSMAAAVTNVSGRGVGMDVVRSNIETIGGQVEVDSEVGVGTVWRLRIPLTLAIMPALTVASGSEIYAIPQVNLLELVALDTNRTAEAIEHINHAEVYRLRGELLPLVRLTDVLQTKSGEAESMVIAVLRADNQRFGLVVDRVMNNEEIVVKPLASQLKSTGTYAGATLMGDGRVALILDVSAIARRSLTGEVNEMAVRGAMTTAHVIAPGTEFLVVAIDASRQAAIELSAVTRLEQIPANRLEVLGDGEVLQYRGGILPVIRLASLLGGATDDSAEQLAVVIFSRGERSVAMVVGAIVEIVNDRGAERRPAQSHALTELVVLSGKVTEVVDLPLLLTNADPNYYAHDVELSSPDGFDSDATLLSSFDAQMAGM